jgi:hypothetical protein
MCQFVSFKFRPIPELPVRVEKSLVSHELIDGRDALNGDGWREGHYLPGGTMECRAQTGDTLTPEQCVTGIKARWPDFGAFLAWALAETGQMEQFSGSLDLSGCDLSKVKTLTLPTSIGGSLDLRGCDLSKVETWPTSIGGSLYLSGCDLSKVKTWPTSIGGYLYLSGCDLTGIVIPNHLKNKVVK